MIDYKKILIRITEKWPAKVLSIVAAIFLFTFHRMSDIHERYFTVPLHLDIAGNLLPCSIYPQNVRITIRGSNNIYNISENDIEAHLDLSRYSEPGIYKGQVIVLKKGRAEETEILEITADPSEISLDIDLRISKTVPLVPNFHGYLEEGYEMVSYNLEPKQVIVDGPEKLMLAVSEIRTDYIDIRGRSSDFTTHINIINPNQLIRIRGDLVAEFRCFIKELIVIRNFDSLRIVISGLDDSFEALLDPPLASVKVHGELSVLEGISANMLLVGVHCGDISEPGFYELPLYAETEKEFTIDRIEPEMVNVEIRQKEKNEAGNQ